MEIDRKFRFIGFNPSKPNKIVTEENAVLFLASDPAFLLMLPAYREMCIKLGAKENQIEGIDLLIQRVERFQLDNPRLVKAPDIDDGPEAAKVLAPNP